MRLLLSLALCVGLVSTFGSASPPQQTEPSPVLSVRTDLVTLPVTVIDRRGEFVTGLREHNFTVYDNGEPQPIQFFSSEDLPATVGLVVDSSGSMRGRRDDVAAAAMAFAAMSHMLDELFVVNFNERVWLGLAPSVAFTEDMDDIRAALADTPAQGMSALYEAVDRALDHLQLGVHDRKALIVVSDGGDNASVRTLDAVLDHARRTQAVIYAVAPFDPDNREAKPAALKMLARETGGRAFLARRSDDVTRSFTEIAKELRSGYTIGFEPPEPTAHAFRPIRVIVNAGGTRSLVARTRAGYYAEPSGRTVR